MFIAAVAIPNMAAAASSRRVQPRHAAPETASTAIAAPTMRSHATVCGATSSNSSTAMVAPMYWKTADRTNSASGEAVSRNRVTGRLPGRPGARTAISSGRARFGPRPQRAWMVRSALSDPASEASHQSKSSGSVRQISCQSGWKLNHPASGKPVCAAVYEAYSCGMCFGSPAAIAIS